jgi:hypothetical protein
MVYRMSLMAIWVGVMFGFAHSETKHAAENSVNDIIAAGGSRVTSGLSLTM